MAKQKKRIILTGAQGTGKTTLMNALATDGTKTLSIAREQAIEAGWSPETGSSEDYQKKLFAALLKAVSSKKNYISDRGLTCVAAYTFDGALSGSINRKTADLQYGKLQKFHNDNPDVLLVYLPIEFELEDDGTRNTDKANQLKMDFLIKNLLDTSGVKYITVTGSVEERVKQIEESLK
jgi:predicted ATPase